MRKLLMVVAMIMLIPGLASAGGGGDISQCYGFASGTRVSMLDSCFQGIAHFAPADSTITVSNDGGFPHTFTAVDGSFDSGEVQPGGTFEFTIDEPGIYQVFCSLHGTADGMGMAGVLVVGEAEPLPVSAQIDPTVIKRAVAEENQILAEALDRQTLAIGNLSTAQASLRSSLEEVTSAASEAAGQSPAIVTVPVESNDGLWVALIAGLGAGLALALLATHWPGRRSEAKAIREGLPASAES